MASDARASVTESFPNHSRRAQISPRIVPSDEIERPTKRRRESESVLSRSLVNYQSDFFEPPQKAIRLSLAANQSSSPFDGASAPEEEPHNQAGGGREEQNGYEGGIQQLTKPQGSFVASESPSYQATISSMSGATQTMSRSPDTPQIAPTAAMEPSSKAVKTPLSIPTGDIDRVQAQAEGTPQSPSNIAGPTVTESPTAMDVDEKAEALVTQQVSVQEERAQPGSLSYPGSLQSSNMAESPARGMSFPMPSQNQSSPSSATGKKHKCPYCNTEFTRHHNLKSHLLTHSQEKPYVCTECQMRFRRLHDLKRHGKLHTGEKPHVCPKCDRKFARGDALARHSKGAGGCAGRRSSMGSFADGDELDGEIGEGDESAMAGIAYDNADEEDLRRQSLPSMSAQHISGVSGDQYGGHARTYPPVGARGTSGGLYAPILGQGQAANTATPTTSSGLIGGHPQNTIISTVVGSGSTGIYSQGGMAEAGKPLSPSLPSHDNPGIPRQRSPSLSQQIQQQQVGRRQSELQSPHSGQVRPKLPGLSHPGFAASGSAGFTHGRTPSGTTSSGDSGNMFAQSDPSVWAYIQTLEDKIKSLSEKVVSLDHEVNVLKKQFENREGVSVQDGI